MGKIVALSHFHLLPHDTMPKKSVKRIGTKTKKAAPKPVGQAAQKPAKPTGAGRPKGSGTYGCETQSVRVPIHLVQAVKDFAMRKIKAGQ